MAEESDTKLNPAAEQSSTTDPKLAKDEINKVTSEATAGSDAQTYTEMASNAASGVGSSVFSMFGGGAKKEKKEEADDTNEPSGSSKKKEGDVCTQLFWCCSRARAR